MLKEVTNKTDKALGTKRFRVENVELVIRHFGEEDEEMAIRFRGESAIASSFRDRAKLLDSITEIVKFTNSHQATEEIETGKKRGLKLSNSESNLSPVKRQKLNTLRVLMQGLTKDQKTEAVNLGKTYGLDIAINYCNTVGRKAN